MPATSGDRRGALGAKARDVWRPTRRTWRQGPRWLATHAADMDPRASSQSTESRAMRGTWKSGPARRRARGRLMLVIGHTQSTSLAPRAWRDSVVSRPMDRRARRQSPVSRPLLPCHGRRSQAITAPTASEQARSTRGARPPSTVDSPWRPVSSSSMVRLLLTMGGSLGRDVFARFGDIDGGSTGAVEPPHHPCCNRLRRARPAPAREQRSPA